MGWDSSVTRKTSKVSLYIRKENKVCPKNIQKVYVNVNLGELRGNFETVKVNEVEASAE